MVPGGVTFAMRGHHGLLILVVGVCTGCGRTYHLPGHSSENLKAPPNVTMRVGEQRKAITTGLNVKDMGFAGNAIMSDDPKIVRIHSPDRGTAYLVAASAGTAQVHYYYHPTVRSDPENRGFLVTVVPAKKPSHRSR